MKEVLVVKCQPQESPANLPKRCKRIPKGCKRVPKGYQHQPQSANGSPKERPVEKYGRQCCEQFISWSKMVAKSFGCGSHFGCYNGSKSMSKKVGNILSKATRMEANSIPEIIKQVATTNHESHQQSCSLIFENM